MFLPVNDLVIIPTPGF